MILSIYLVGHFICALIASGLADNGKDKFYEKLCYVLFCFALGPSALGIALNVLIADINKK